MLKDQQLFRVITIQQLELLEIEYQIVNEKNFPKLDLLEEELHKTNNLHMYFKKTFKKDNRSLEKRSDYKKILLKKFIRSTVTMEFLFPQLENF